MGKEKVNVIYCERRLQRHADVDQRVVNKLKREMIKLNDQELVDFCRNVVDTDGGMPSLDADLMANIDDMLAAEGIFAADFARLVLTSSHFNPDEAYVVLDNELRSYTTSALASMYREKLNVLANAAAELGMVNVK